MPEYLMSGWFILSVEALECQKWTHLIFDYILNWVISAICRSQWPRGLRRRSAAARLLRLWVRIPPGLWTFVCCECCVLLGRGLCDDLITRLEESYRLRCVVVCDLETSWMRRPWLIGGCRAKNKQIIPVIFGIHLFSWFYRDPRF